MASWTDKPLQLNPYIAHTPVQAYIDVEHYKQQQYDQGVQAIDSTFDSIANLPVDSKYSSYVNASISQLAQGVKKVAGADFSNSQLINQIENSAKQIASDPIIQNGVMSASIHKQNLDIIQDDKKNGKLTPQNKFDYDEQYATWKTNPDLSQPFNGEYSTHVDYQKKAIDAIQKLNPTANITDIPFETDEAGNIDYSKIGTAMTERGYKGVSPDQIKTLLQATLSEEDLNQIRIDAKYRFRNYAPEDLAKITESKYQTSKTSLQAKKQELEQRAKLYPQSTELGQQIKSSLDYINEQLGADGKKGTLDTQKEDEIAWIKKNPEQAKTELYKNTYMDQFSKAFSYMDQSLKYVENPYTKYDEWVKGYSMDVQKYNLDVSKYNHDLTQDEFNNNAKLQELDLKRAELGLKKGANGSTSVGGLITDLGLNPSDITVKSSVQTVADISTGYFNTANALTEKVLTDITKPGESRNAALGRLNTMITQYQNGDLSQIPTYMQTEIGDIIKNKANGANISSWLQDVQKQASESLRTTPAYKQMQADINSRHTLKLGGYVFSPQEVASFKAKENPVTIPTSSLGAVGSSYYDIDESSLTQKEKVLYNYLKGVRYGPTDGTETPDKRMVDKYVSDFGNIVDQNKSLITQKENLEEQYVRNRTPTFVPQAQDLTPDSKVRETFFGGIANIVSTRIGGDKGGNEGLDPSVAMDLVTGKNNANTKVGIVMQPGNNQLILLNGDKKQVIKLTDKEAYQLQPDLANQNSELATRLAIGRNTTNYLGKPEGALYQKADFKSIKKLNTTADLHPLPGQYDSNGNPLFTIEYNTQINGKWAKLELPTPLTIDQIRMNIQGVTDDMLLEAYNQQNKQ